MTPTLTRVSLGRLGQVIGPWKGVLGYGAFTIAMLVIALLFGLPHELIARRAIDEATREIPVRVVFEDVAFSFPSGYRLENVRLSHRETPQYMAEISEITVSTPLLGVLFGPIDSADFSGSLYDGTFDGTVQTTNGKVDTSVRLDEVSLAKLSRRLLPSPGALGGTASLDLELSGDGRSTQSSKGKIKLRAKNVSLEGIIAQGFTVPDLTFQTVRLDAELQGARLQIDEFEAAGDEVTVAATGDVLVRDPAQERPEGLGGPRLARLAFPPLAETQPPAQTPQICPAG